MRIQSFSSLLAIVTLTVALGQARPAFAQAMEPEAAPSPLKADLKGTIGLGLIGTELGFVVPALLGARDWWAFVVFPVVGAVGGGVAGYFLLEQGGGEPELSVAALSAGMALFIPAMVVTIAQTAYEPERATTIVARAPAPGGLVRYERERLALSVPAVGVVPGASQRESLRTGASTATALRVSVLSGQF
jgi:hypothetical protein